MQTQDQILKEMTGSKTLWPLLKSAGIKYWGFSILPAIAGITLPFWLNKGFSFDILNALEFIIAVVFFHAGFCLLQRGLSTSVHKGWAQKELIVFGGLCLMLTVILAVHLFTNIQLKPGVYPYLFPAFVLASFFLGFLLVLPPLRLIQHALGEYIFIVAIGMMPVMGGYLVQMGDLHRTVYIASFPLIFATGLWVWISKLITRAEDEKNKTLTLVTLFPEHFAARYLTSLITIGIYLSVILAVVFRSSLSPYSLIAFASIGLAYRIIVISWREHEDATSWRQARKYAFQINLIVAASVCLSSLFELFTA
jgi:1,4-dihydroxy-2-naphthoate octaprenyltransferase